jgi:threonylcarbamoyladenosine tRNA methylthiotransferase MtaB
MPKAKVQTLGCRLNQAESAIIAKSLRNAGFEIVADGQPADLTVINTCTVTEQADSKCRQAVRRALRLQPDTFVAVVGCYAQLAAETIKSIKGVDLIIGNEHKLKLIEYLNGLRKSDRPRVIHSSKISREEFTIDGYGLYENETRANLKIQDGCNFVCNFCIIPAARGPARSRKLDNLVREAELLVEAGHQELVLTGVNIGTYQNKQHNILDVIKALEKITNLKRLRISSIEPTTIPDDLLHHLADSEKMCKHLHIPLQSGDDRILQSMRRKYTAKEFADFIGSVKQTVPDIGIGTDVMVGYPGEGDQEFINTKKLLADLPVSYYHVFTYSDRPGTGSYKLQPKVPQAVKKLRTRIMIEQGQRKRYTFYESHLGTTVTVLFEQPLENGNWVGYTSNYMNVEVICRSSAPDLHNKLLPVKLIGLTGRSIVGELKT